MSDPDCIDDLLSDSEFYSEQESANDKLISRKRKLRNFISYESDEAILGWTRRCLQNF